MSASGSEKNETMSNTDDEIREFFIKNGRLPDRRDVAMKHLVSRTRKLRRCCLGDFDQQYLDLSQFISENGRFPKKYASTIHEYKLNFFCRQCHFLYSRRFLTEDQIARMEKLGFIGDRKEFRFETSSKSFVKNPQSYWMISNEKKIYERTISRGKIIDVYCRAPLQKILDLFDEVLERSPENMRESILCSKNLVLEKHPDAAKKENLSS